MLGLMLKGFYLVDIGANSLGKCYGTEIGIG